MPPIEKLTELINFWNRMYYLAFVISLLAGGAGLFAYVRSNDYARLRDIAKDEQTKQLQQRIDQNEIFVNGVPVHKKN